MKTPAVQLGVGKEALDAAKKLSLFKNLQVDKAARTNPWSTAALLCSVTDGLCGVHYMRGEWPLARRWSLEVVDSVDYYLFGDWRLTAITDEGVVNPDWWFSHGIGWTTELGDGLCWSAVSGEWDKVGRFLTFPSESVSEDVEGKIPRAFYIGLARWWNDHADLAWIEELRRMSGSGCKDYRSRCDVLEAISSCNVERATRSFEKYLKYWLRSMKTSPQCLAKSASFLWHVAHHEEINLELCEELSLHVIGIPT